jgi:E3 ubiquitin-protein ligase HUWE1
LHVRRARILEESYGQLNHLSAREWLGNWRVSFVGEPGVDGGGLYREWFACIIRQLFNADYALFLPTVSGRSFQPNPGSAVNSEHLRYFEFTGRIYAVALGNGVNLAAHLAIPFLKRLVGDDITLGDLEDLDPGMHTTMRWLLDNSVADLPETLAFVADEQNLGVHEQIELKPEGAGIVVTDENKAEYVALMVDHTLRKKIESQVTAFANGFHDLVPQEIVAVLNAEELDRVICGENHIDVDDWKRHCRYSGMYGPEHPVIQRFFGVIRDWSQDNLTKLLQFVTGCPRVPLGGFSQLNVRGTPIIIARVPNSDRLIASHTCVNTLDLPEYETEEEMNEKLLYAVSNCQDYGFY